MGCDQLVPEADQKENQPVRKAKADEVCGDTNVTTQEILAGVLGVLG